MPIKASEISVVVEIAKQMADPESKSEEMTESEFLAPYKYSPEEIVSTSPQTWQPRRTSTRKEGTNMGCSMMNIRDRDLLDAMDDALADRAANRGFPEES